MKALVFERSLPRFAAARVAGTLAPGGGARVGPLRLTDVDPPELPGPGWKRVRPRLAGICGSDLATVDGQSSRYFEPIVSFPFVPGHEVVGELDDGTRVVVQPTLTCAARGVEPVCAQCASGNTNRCERTAFGHLEPGLQTGYCADTGGGWSLSLVAHESQLYAVPDGMSDETAVMVEPAACGVHAALLTAASEFAVIGAGTLGLCTIAALRTLTTPHVLIAAAKHPAQKQLARELGADIVVEPDGLARAVRRAVPGTMVAGGQLTSGVDAVFDCVGSESSLAQALEVVAPGGTIVLLGMPGRVSVDLTSLWHREVSVRGAYTYTNDDFAKAFDLVQDARLERLVSGLYLLDRWKEAIEHAADAGRRGAVKIAFDLRNERGLS
ncbi:MAG: zinc-binding dehydrogenase [Acidimicrobiia bacterium]|nr:zinc-binding dehydrogenase [Acidimicrobiia bacterium]MBV9283339.1 zinc-binding dehydrogenase [Acidimicrobiia bacterium]